MAIVKCVEAPVPPATLLLCDSASEIKNEEEEEDFSSRAGQEKKICQVFFLIVETKRHLLVDCNVECVEVQGAHVTRSK